jgi:hypothetical protein
MEFECKRCGFKSRYKGVLKTHLTKKKPCDCLSGNVTREDCLMELKDNRTQDDGVHVCQYCNKPYKTRQSKCRHEKGCCQKPGGSGAHEKSMEALCEIVEQLKNEVNQLKRTNRPTNCTNTTNNIINSNSQTIVVNAFGRETTDHLSDAFLMKCIKRTNQGLVQLLEKLHFDPEVKENANVRILNKKLPLAEVRDEAGDWRYACKDTVITDMVDRGQGILQEHFDDNQEEIKDCVSGAMFDYIVNWFHKMEDKDKSVLEDVLTNVYILLLNKSRAMAANG